LPYKQGVAGSSPVASTINDDKTETLLSRHFYALFLPTVTVR